MALTVTVAASGSMATALATAIGLIYLFAHFGAIN